MDGHTGWVARIERLPRVVPAPRDKPVRDGVTAAQDRARRVARHPRSWSRADVADVVGFYAEVAASWNEERGFYRPAPLRDALIRGARFRPVRAGSGLGNRTIDADHRCRVAAGGLRGFERAHAGAFGPPLEGARRCRRPAASFGELRGGGPCGCAAFCPGGPQRLALRRSGGLVQRAGPRRAPVCPDDRSGRGVRGGRRQRSVEGARE